MNLSSKTDKAWLAGFVDGEGYIGIVRTKKVANLIQSNSFLYHPWLILTSTDKNVIQEVTKVSSYAKWALHSPTAGHKIAYQVKITQFDSLIEILENILPYLKIKAQQAKLVIEFCKHRKIVKINTGRGSRGLSSFGIVDEDIYNNLLKLNKRGI